LTVYNIQYVGTPWGMKGSDITYSVQFFGFHFVRKVPLM